MAEEIYKPDPLMIEESLEEWVMTKCENWRDYYESNYEQHVLKNTIGYGEVNGTLMTLNEHQNVLVLSLLRFSRL